MKKGVFFYLQLAFTLLICAFLIVPVFMSITAGLTNNYWASAEDENAVNVVTSGHEFLLLLPDLC